MAQFPLLPTTDPADLRDDVRALLDELTAERGDAVHAYTGECRPATDVIETEDSVEIVLDVAGVPPQALRVAFRANALLIVGDKAPPVGSQGRAYHLVEREFGRFARVVPLTGAFDVPAARATLRAGELTVVLPRLRERRARIHAIPVTRGGTPHP